MMIFIFIFCSLYIISAAVTLLDPWEVSYQVELMYKQKLEDLFIPKCDGAIVGKTWVLIPTYCITPISDLRYWIIRRRRKTGGEHLDAVISAIHNNKHLTLLQTEASIVNNGFKDAQLYRSLYSSSNEIIYAVSTASVWKKDEKRGSLKLQKFDMITINREICMSLYKDKLAAAGLGNDDIICVREVTHAYTCDFYPAGAPLTFTGKLIGIAADRFMQCVDKNATYVYYDLDKYHNWIYKFIN